MLQRYVRQNGYVLKIVTAGDSFFNLLFNQFRQYFFTLCLFVFLINSGKLFHREGPTNEIAFWPMFVLRKGILSLAYLFLISILQCLANSKIYFRWQEQVLLTNLNVIRFKHRLTLFFFFGRIFYTSH